MLAEIVNVSHLVEVFGYPLLFLAVMAESSGLPVPGETGLITAAILASRGKLQIEFVIPLAALAAIVGDNIGYVIGRKGGRWALERPGRFYSQRRQVIDLGEPFFERHGPKAVFFGRFVLGLRVWASWLAGATRMHWRSFAFWNALGGICWATAIGLVAYFLGNAAGSAISTFGLYGLVAVLIAAVSVFIAHRRHRRRLREGLEQPSSSSPSEPQLPVDRAAADDATVEPTGSDEIAVAHPVVDPAAADDAAVDPAADPAEAGRRGPA